MKLLISIVFMSLFISDFFFRIYPSPKGEKELQINLENMQATAFNHPKKPSFNKDLFGEVNKVEKKVKKGTKEKKDVEKKLKLLALYSTPEPFAYVNVEGGAGKPIKLRQNETYQGFELVELKSNSAIFKKAGKNVELRVFKRLSNEVKN